MIARDEYGNRLDDLVPALVIDLTVAMAVQPVKRVPQPSDQHRLSTYMKPRPEHMQGAAVPIFTPWPSKCRPELAIAPPPPKPSFWSERYA